MSSRVNENSRPAAGSLSLRSRNALVLFHSLPVELICSIFLMAVASDTYADKLAWMSDRNLLHRLRTIGMVCSVWHDISLNFPHLWSTVPLNLPTIGHPPSAAFTNLVL